MKPCRAGRRGGGGARGGGRKGRSRREVGRPMKTNSINIVILCKTNAVGVTMVTINQLLHASLLKILFCCMCSGMIQHSTAQHSTAQHSKVHVSTAQHSTAQRNAVQHSTAAQHRLHQRMTQAQLENSMQHKELQCMALLMHE